MELSDKPPFPKGRFGGNVKMNFLHNLRPTDLWPLNEKLKKQNNTQLKHYNYEENFIFGFSYCCICSL